ncbi:MAG: hypothetical protein BWY37_02024 [Firmicutes bacterium ADurb.Bin262]|nr:MAG: hypothetical protein BWY37_02024 [Firmicutes bacterium ADurb.Bin262]
MRHADNRQTVFTGLAALLKRPVDKPLMQSHGTVVVVLAVRRRVGRKNARIQRDKAVPAFECDGVRHGAGFPGRVDIKAVCLCIAEVGVIAFEKLRRCEQQVGVLPRRDTFAGGGQKMGGAGVVDIVVAVDNEHFDTRCCFKGAQHFLHADVSGLFAVIGQVAGDDEVISVERACGFSCLYRREGYFDYSFGFARHFGVQMRDIFEILRVRVD